MDEDQIIKNFVENLSIALPDIESKGSGGYNAQSKDSTATGKYQFTKEWLDDIQKFAENFYGPIESMDDFKNNPQLQDDFFRYYAKETLYPQAKKAVSGKNPKKLSLEEAGALFHFKDPGSAKQSISTGNLADAQYNKEGKKINISEADYLNRINKSISSVGIPKTEATAFMDEKSKTSIYEQYKKREAEINAMADKGVPQGSIEKLRKRHWQEAYDRGELDVINEGIREENKLNQAEYDKYRNLENVLDGAVRGKYDKTDAISFETTSENQAGVEQAIKDFPELFSEYQRVQKRRGGGKGRTGESYNEIYIPQHKAKEFANRIFAMGVDGKVALNMKETYGNSWYNSFSKLIPDKLKSGAIADSKKTLVKEGKVAAFQPTQEIDPKYLEQKPKVYEEPKPKEEAKPEAKTETTTNTATTETEKQPVSDYGEEYFQRELGLANLNDDQLNYQPGKREIPVDAIMGMALGLIGNNQAEKAKLPLRTEEVSNAFKNYTSEIAQRAQHGLPVEVEAAMKNQLADAYQGGLANIVNASGGNAATVLGNLGSLEASKNKGLVAIQVADYEAKDRAFAQYGDALKYQNEFDARRDIANHGIKYGEALRKKLQGEQLATAGFAKLIDAIKYDKENGPGSANDMYRSMLMQKMFGFDPKMKDDLSGTVPGTKSFYDMQRGKATKRYEQTEQLYKQYGLLNPDQKKAYSQLLENSTDFDTQQGFMEHLINNPEADLSKLSMDNIDLAIKNKDYGLLSLNRKDALKSISTNNAQPIEQTIGLGGSAPLSTEQTMAIEDKPEQPEMSTPPYVGDGVGLLGY